MSAKWPSASELWRRELLARAETADLPDLDLADLVDDVARQPRGFTPQQRRALLHEAANRLRLRAVETMTSRAPSAR